MTSSSATVGVDKATSDLLIGPDWTMNIDICDSINSHRWQPKDVIKALKKRLQHKNPKVQLLALTLLETMVKNCGDIVHFQIADRNILQEMIKIVRKKMDMHVRDKILVLLDSWQEAFGGAGGKYPQYYWAYEELRRSGVQFPERSRDAAPIHTPPAAPSAPRHSQAGYGMPSDTSRRLDEAMASETENLSMANLYSMRSVQELLSDMLQAVNPTDREAIKDEVIVDLVSQCRSHQRKLMQMLTSTGDEQLLGQGLELNDSLQSVLAKHDAIASGSPLPAEMINNSPSGSPLPAEVINISASPVPTEVRDASPISNPAATSIASATSSQLEEEEDEDDDFAQLARRRTKASAMSSEISVQSNGAVPAPSTSSPSNALVLTTPPPAVRTSATKEQDIIDLLSITLSTTSVSPHAPQSNTNQTMNQVPYSTTTEGNPYGSQVYTENQGQATYSNYVAPWAQPQPQQQQWVAPQPQPWVGQQSQPRPQQWVAQQSQPQAQQWATQQSQQQPQQWAGQQAQPWVQHQAQPPQAPVQPQPWTEQQAPQHPQQQQQPQAQAQLQAQPQQPQPQPWAQHQAQPQQPQSQQQSWAPPASQPQPQPWVQQQAQTQPQPQTQPWAQPQSQQWGQQQAQGQSQAWAQRQQQSQPQAQAPRQSFNYPPPPWATATTTTTQVAKLQSHNSFPARGSNGSAISEGHKPFIPSYRLFEDLNVLGSSDGASTNSPRMSGKSMLGGGK
ncbi:hypothetical protein MKW98_020704 [Papaver atlanticum]|uniref:Uncharacterized protein n=1 Tax=Papaver atlanticum TaxID=357466 RepID=A0AAD4TI73_9MAGN|nr:hypothetical protein MKW98_020704 [Papaver atlanticum]